jgi:anaerobic selenocysteine-containing dehydrogenase
MTEQIPTFCALCVSRCGAIATIDGGRLAALEADPQHPTGAALCIKGKVAPELVYHRERLTHPLRRTRPKGDADPGWQVISWDEACATIAAQLRRIAAEHGPEAVVFASASPSTSAMSDSIDWLQRLRRAYGSPNFVVSMELCGWGRYLASTYTFGVPVPGAYMPDIERAGCILYWGYDPVVARLVHATATTAALKRGARLVVVDPRRAGFAHRADAWLRVRPGTDGALALAITHVMIERGWFDRDFVVRWTNAPVLVRADGRLLRAGDLGIDADADAFVAWDEATNGPVAWPRAGSDARPSLRGAFELATAAGPMRCRPVLDHVAELCRRHAPERSAAITGVGAADVERAARLLWEARPVAFYAWSGIEQHDNATQTVRAIAQLYALTGSLDEPGGNVLFGAVAARRVDGAELLPPAQKAKALGLARRPLGPARWEFVTTEDFYAGALEGRPYRVKALVGFGANLLVSQADGQRGRAALSTLDFVVHADLFMNPTAEQADIVLPVASPFETEALRVGFEVSPEAQGHMQLRRQLVAPAGESRSDLRIIFDLATRLGLGEHFFGGDIEAAFRHQLEGTGVTLEQLRADPRGLAAGRPTRHRKHEPRGFPTRSRTIELYSEELLEHGYAPLPEFIEPQTSPRSRPDLATRFPLVLTSAKGTMYCESQHRGLPSLRRRAPDPEVALHPDAARSRSIAAGDWVRIETPHGSVRARAHLDAAIAPDVVIGQHGWWQACPEIGAPGYDAFGDGTANLNLILRLEPSDPISGSVPLRANLCEIVREA